MAELEAGLTDEFATWWLRLLANVRRVTTTTTRTSVPVWTPRARNSKQHGRLGAFKMIVLMTDGQANWHNGYYDINAARNHVHRGSQCGRRI